MVLVRVDFGEAPADELEDRLERGPARVAAATACGAEIIATRNVRDYEGSRIPARTPAELLE